LAARLTGWRVDIRSETEFAAEEAESGYDQDDAQAGRCAAILANGRRCPNASLPGSKYCGLPAHQAMAESGADAGLEAAAAEPQLGAEEPGADAGSEEAPGAEQAEPVAQAEPEPDSESDGPVAEEPEAHAVERTAE
jgi:N utilization substance protein A